MGALFLASASPRRRELLAQIGVPFSLVSVSVDETPSPTESPEAYVERVARDKALAGLVSLGDRDGWGPTPAWCSISIFSASLPTVPTGSPCWRRYPGVRTGS